VDSNNFLSDITISSSSFIAVYIIIAVGAALMLVSFFGCCGAVKENRCMLGTVSMSIRFQHALILGIQG